MSGEENVTGERELAHGMLSEPEPVLQVSGLSKIFPGHRKALINAGLDVYPGEIHGLVGQNGSGKSTLIKVLAGYHAPEPGGSLRVHGQEVRLPLAPGEFRDIGMSFVHQNLGLVGSMSLLDNVCVGKYKAGIGWRIAWGDERLRVASALERFGLRLDPEEKVANLPASTQAVVAIARAIEEIEAKCGQVMILDEPTASLAREETEQVLAAMREAAERGVGILFVSHRLDEVLRISKRVTVLRDGFVVGTVATAGLDEDDLIEMIIGRRLEDLYPTPPEPGQDRIMQVRHLSGQIVTDVSLDVYAGEVIGLTGLLNSGFEEIPYLLAGVERAERGELSVDGSRHLIEELSIRDCIRRGLVLVPANREQQGAVPRLTLRENVTLPRASRYYRRLRMNVRREADDVAVLLHRFDVRPPEPDRVFGTLSGGNQQKALLAKWLEGRPQILMMHEPTQGVDVGARKQIFAQIRDTASAGCAVILASVEYEDLSHLCDRVLVFRDGRVAAELFGTALTKDRIVAECYKSGETERRSGA